jgi:hypothetical protein
MPLVACQDIPVHRLNDLIEGDSVPEQTISFWTDANGTIPHDLTGVSVRLQFRRDRDMDPVLSYGTSDASIVVEGTPTPNIVRLVERPPVANLKAGTLYGDLEITYPSGRVSTPIRLELRVDRSYTR